MSHVREINDPAGLDALRAVWGTLHEQTPQATHFQSLDWLQTYWRHYGADQRLRVLVVSMGAKPVGILPLTVRTEATKLGGIQVLTYPLHDWGSFYGPIGPNPTITLITGLKYIHNTPRDWDLLDLRWVPHDGHDAGRTAAALTVTGYLPTVQPAAESSWVELTDGWDAYWASRKSEWRTNVRRSEKKIAALGQVEYVRYRPAGAARGEGDPRWDLYEQCERLAERSWQGSSTTGTTLSHEAIKTYLRDAHQTAVQAGAADLNLLYVAGQPAAFAYGYHYRGYFYGLRMGFDANISHDGLGSVLQHRIIQDSFARGDKIYDLGPDYSPAKRYWRTSLQRAYRLTHYPAASWKAQFLRAKHQLRLWLSPHQTLTPTSKA